MRGSYVVPFVIDNANELAARAVERLRRAMSATDQQRAFEGGQDQVRQARGTRGRNAVALQALLDEQVPAPVRRGADALQRVGGRGLFEHHGRDRTTLFE